MNQCAPSRSARRHGGVNVNRGGCFGLGPSVECTRRQALDGRAAVSLDGRVPCQSSVFGFRGVRPLPSESQPPRSPGENFTEPGLMSVSVSLMSDEIFSTFRVNSVRPSTPSGHTQA